MRPRPLKRRLLLLGVVGLAAYFALFGGEYSHFEQRRFERQTEVRAAELQLMRDSLASLRARADSLESDPAALERLARERYGLIRPGERLYRFIGEPDSTDSTDADSAGADSAREQRLRRPAADPPIP